MPDPLTIDPSLSSNSYQIPIFNFPYDIEEDDEETCEENQDLRSSLPFAIVGSEEEIEINGEPVRVRLYPWGVVE